MVALNGTSLFYNITREPGMETPAESTTPEQPRRNTRKMMSSHTGPTKAPTARNYDISQLPHQKQP